MMKPTMGTMRKVAVLYFVALLLLMWLPLNGVAALNNYVFGLRADHLLHASVYLPCIFYLGRLAPLPAWALWLLSLCIGGVTEGVQYLLPYRGFDVNDLMANAIGVSLGAMALLFLRRKKSLEKTKTNGTID